MKHIKTIITCMLLCSFVAMPVAVVAAPSTLSQTSRSEINHLLTFIEKSGCQFYRNGTWYKDTKAVREHVELKQRYFTERGKISSTEEFIKWCGTKSEVSGKPYLVKCGEGPEMPMGQWLSEELDRYRKEQAR